LLQRGLNNWGVGFDDDNMYRGSGVLPGQHEAFKLLSEEAGAGAKKQVPELLP